MSYVLRKEKLKRGIYFKIYFNFREPGKKYPSNQYVKSLGYAEDLANKGIANPLEYCQKIVQDMNDAINFKIQEDKSEKITKTPNLKYLGYFPLHSIMKRIDVRPDLDILASTRRFSYSVCDCLEAMVYARAVNPCSKKRTIERVIPCLFGSYDFSYDDVLSCLEFIGSHYEKIIEMFSYHVNNTYLLDTAKTYFDCTNYYFEIDEEDSFRRKGPSKENRKDPIVGMGMLLDTNLIPIGMRLYPGNESEKPVLRKIIDELKQANTITSRTVQVADKGLNCARNIHSALKHGDGYIFSKSVKKLSAKEKKWVLADDGYDHYYGPDDKLKFKLKSCIDTFKYKYYDEKFKRWIEFSVYEKRVVTYNPKLAKKQEKEINKMVKKAEKCCASQIKKSEYGECAKYVEFLSQDKNGEITGEAVLAKINRDKVKKDLELCGFNMIVTSEIRMESKEIYDTYHQLSWIEETFRCIKKEVEARPVYLSNINKIKGHFLICYLTVLLERIFQFKILENKFGSETIYDFFKSFRFSKNPSGTYNNISVRSALMEYLSDEYALPLLHVYLNNAQIKKVLERRL